MKLCVDCDDTLVLWQYVEKEVGGQLCFVLPNEGETYLPNDALMAAVRRYLAATPGSELVVWSGGGEAYARRWGQMFFPDIPHEAYFKVGARQPSILFNDTYHPLPGDVCIDDQE